MTSLVRFRADQGTFGVAVEDIREVRRRSGLAPIPSSAAAVAGMLPYGDATVTVFEALGASGDQVLVLDPAGQAFALVVQEVAGVMSIDEALIGPPPAGQLGGMVSGIIPGSDGIVMILDAHALARSLLI